MQRLVAEENPDSRRPQTKDLIHREIGIERRAPHNGLPVGAVHPQILRPERGEFFAVRQTTPYSLWLAGAIGVPRKLALPLGTFESKDIRRYL